jgi:16S rRNA (cytosine967-C5)-methyltransferase
VQDAAAALPVRLFGDLRGRRVADLCAAPGGKTAALCLAGAEVTAVDLSAERLVRVKENLDRLALAADLVAADILEWRPERPFDAILLDAPCSSTGTIRRHPDIPWLKTERDIAALADLQARLIARAGDWLVPGGTLVYATCSLEPEEGEAQLARALAALPLTLSPIAPEELEGASRFVTAEGLLRTLPSGILSTDPPIAGLDGFFAARFRRH